MKIDEEHIFWGTARGVLFIRTAVLSVCRKTNSSGAPDLSVYSTMSYLHIFDNCTNGIKKYKKEM